MELHIDTFNRLSLGIMEKNKCSPDEAIQTLESLRLNLVCGEEISRSLPLQAALITAVNTGKRAFLGGVHVQMISEVKCLLNWPGKNSLNEIITELGGTLVDTIEQGHFSLAFGLPGLIDENRLQIVCNDWQAGVLTGEEEISFESSGTIPTAGIFAGGLAVALAFFKMSGIQIAAADQSTGISLWRPDLDWLDDEAKGPLVQFLPQKYWVLGLGHLGQAYLWNIGLLPYHDLHKVTVLLQDDDKLAAANWSAGLLSEINNKNSYKTRICSRWLEDRGFNTIITERRFDEHTKRMQEEPFVALCGFDSALSRLALEQAGFDLIVESGLGGNLATFDVMGLHTFPDAAKSPYLIWGDMDESETTVNPVVYGLIKDMADEACGIIPLTIAGKTISASFVGACAGAFVMAELIRGLHGGTRYDKINFQLRDLKGKRAIIHKSAFYSFEQSRNGFLSF